MAKEESYTYYEYKQKFSNDCLRCDGTGEVRGKPFSVEQVDCPECEGTGRRDKKTIKDLIAEAVSKVRRERVGEGG